jgi:DNA-binding NarL/FixJ family response regulator
MGPVRVLLADDHEIVRKGLRALIEVHSGWEIVAEVRDAVAKAKLTNPHIAVLDISMPLLNGLEAARQISKSGLQT